MFQLIQPRVSLGIFPTPLHRLQRFGKFVGHDNLYIKRDDLTGLGLGGNKTRSLEFLLGDALARQADVVITAGGLQSNLCALSAAACARLGLECILVHNDVCPERLEGNMLLNHLFGAKPRFIGKTDEVTRAVAMEDLARQFETIGRRPYIIHNGASVPLGGLGYAEAARELYQQSEAMGIDLRHVAIVGAMGGTASGLVYGASLLGAPFHVHVISVEYPAGELRQRIVALIQGMSQVTGLYPAIDLDQVMTIHEQFLGRGYAMPTTASREALIDLPRTEGILLEDVYTSKTLSGVVGLIETGVIAPTESCCYIHTGGMGSLFAQDIS